MHNHGMPGGGYLRGRVLFCFVPGWIRVWKYECCLLIFLASGRCGVSLTDKGYQMLYYWSLQNMQHFWGCFSPSFLMFPLSTLKSFVCQCLHRWTCSISCFVEIWPLVLFTGKLFPSSKDRAKLFLIHLMYPPCFGSCVPLPHGAEGEPELYGSWRRDGAGHILQLGTSYEASVLLIALPGE